MNTTPFDLATIAGDLPAATLIPRLETTLSTSPANLVIVAPPGTGKTTVVPPSVANTLTEGKILVTAPRRVAVRAAARRLAQLAGTPIGTTVGFSVRGEHHPGSRVEFLTPGVLVRKLLSDPELRGVSAVIIDEVHERQLDTDLVLGMTTELSQLRDDFSVIAMSATVDAQHFAALMEAQVLEAQSPIFPVDTIYAPPPGPRMGQRGVERRFLEHVARQAAGHDGSVLVFVPGVWEIEQVIATLRSRGERSVLPLHGRLTAAEQDRALTPSTDPRIVVSTPLAESSLTVPGVRVVVDSGLSRVPRRDAARGMTGLVTVSCAQSSADQRAGRAGREGPGTVIRCYSQEDYAHFQPFTTPEIQSADLTQTALWMAGWGTPELPTPPPVPAMQAATSTLQALGAVDKHGITDLGRRLALLPLAPQLGASLLRFGAGAAETLAVLADAPSGNISTQATRLRGSARFDREVARLRRLAPRVAGRPSAGEVTGAAFPALIAKRVTRGEYLLASGTRALLKDTELQGSPWLAIGNISRSGDRALIRAAASISEEQALGLLGVRDTTHAELANGRIRARTIRHAWAIELSSTPTTPTVEDAATAVAEAIARDGLSLFTFSEAARSLLDRLRFLHAHLGDPWPDVDAADVYTWLGPELDTIAHGASISGINMAQALQRLLPWPDAAHMDELAPGSLHVPSGHKHRIDYSTGHAIVRVKLQECFGLAASPEFCGERVQFHLLSPAGRPLAVTDDLASFWSGPYSQVRAEMRGRYPKHPWPEDPWSAQATARTKRRL
ncbi:ATP-dependent helicase HrpB [Corynebacterium pacaense]|uniref:ATP-dependent helicase HrpB n=1 Tax=Corynebacterium pacaense TaxID=1816684 RepID=UPI0009BB5A36|nr:ATP-dependent helicase HrpB [Corynebacterium pacaense]